MTKRSTPLRRPTIKEVAKLAGVSFKTVARVVNKEGNVHPSRQEAVLRAMEMLKYTPNISGKQLATSRSFLIALLFNVSANFVARAQSGAIRKCRETGHHVIVEEVPEGFEEVISDRLQQLRVDGVMVLPPLSYSEPLLSALRARDLKVVQVAPGDPHTYLASVGISDYDAAYEVTTRLIEMGHADIAFIAGGTVRASAARHDGYRAAHAKAGLSPSSAHQQRGDFSFESGERCGHALLTGANPPSAIFAANDLMALGVMVAAEKLQRSIPGDLSLVGFDDSPLAVHAWPQLTTVRQPLEAMTSAAVDILLDEQRLSSREAFLLPYVFIERGSTSAPASLRPIPAPPAGTRRRRSSSTISP